MYCPVCKSENIKPLGKNVMELIECNKCKSVFRIVYKED